MNPTGTSSNPGTPSNLGTPSNPGTPSNLGSPSSPGTPSNLDSPSSPDSSSNLGTPSSPRRIAVIGGGIAGVAAAYELAKMQREGAPLQATLFEASDRLGGIVETVRQDGFTIECGPDAWVTEKPWARELAIELGLENEIVASNDASRRTYVLQGKQLVAMPDGLRMMVPSNWAAMLSSPLFSAQAKLAYLSEPRRAAELKAHALARVEDESVSDFVRRHFGDEVTAKLAAPLLSGVFGGDIKTLSAHAVMAPFVAMEREHGSLILAVQQRARSATGNAPVFTTLKSGLGTLIDAMAARLPQDGVRLREPVTGLERSGNGWIVRSGAFAHPFDAVIVAAPAHAARELMRPLDERAAELLAMEASSAIIVALGFLPGQAATMRLPRGFGFLVPQQAAEDDRVLAATFVHQKFPHRVPAGGALLRAFFGGANAQRLTGEPDSALAALAHRDLSRILGPLPQPSFQLVRRWPRSLPQYAVGHIRRIAELEQRLAAIPGLQIIGNACHGVGLPDLVRDGRRAARDVVHRLAPTKSAQA